MSYTLKNKFTVPPEPGFEYKQHETGYKADGKSLYDTIQLVITHRIANNLPRQAPEEAAEDVENQICHRLGGDWCDNVSWRFSEAWDKIRAGTKTLMLWAKTDKPYVEQSEADRRADLCANCFARRTTSGCLSCGFMDLVRKLIGETCSDRVSKIDDRSSCLVCECLLRCKVHIKSEILKQGTSDIQKQAYSEIPHCWMNDIDK